VLLACAQDGQQRPGLAASADLIKGAIRMRLRMAGRPPRTVRAAIRLMCAAAAAELAVLISTIVTADSVRSAVGRRYPGLPAAQHAVHVTDPSEKHQRRPGPSLCAGATGNPASHANHGQ
jgi:hypothetical protein